MLSNDVAVNHSDNSAITGTNLNNTPEREQPEVTGTSRFETFDGPPYTAGVHTWAVRAIKPTPTPYNSTTYETVIGWGPYTSNRTFTLAQPGSLSPSQPIAMRATRTNPLTVYALPSLTEYGGEAPFENEKNAAASFRVQNTGGATMALADWGVLVTGGVNTGFRVTAGSPLTLGPGEESTTFDKRVYLRDDQLIGGAATNYTAQIQVLEGGGWSDVTGPGSSTPFSVLPRPTMTNGMLVKRPRRASSVDPEDAKIYYHRNQRKWRGTQQGLDGFFPGWNTEYYVFPATEVDPLAAPTPPTTDPTIPEITGRNLLYQDGVDVYILEPEPGAGATLVSRLFADEAAFFSYGYSQDVLSFEPIPLNALQLTWIRSVYPIGSAIEHASLDVTYPDGGQILYKGTNYTITWNHQSVTGSIQIDLYKGGTDPSNHVVQLAAGAANTGSYLFNPGTDLTNGSDYRIGISAVNGTVFDFSADFFAIATPCSGPGTPEICDGIDNDCNASTPDGSGESWLNQPCDGADADLCAEGAYVCVSGVQSCSDSSSDSVEICGDLDPATQSSVDNDCDGDPDGMDVDCASVLSVRLEGLEVVQVVQDWQNSIALVANKQTLVRAFFEPTSTVGVPATVRLRGISDPTGQAIDLGTFPPDNPGAGFVLKPDPASYRGNPGGSVYFVLPSPESNPNNPWITGTVKFVVEGVGVSIDCGSYPDCSVTKEFAPGSSPEIVLIAVDYRDTSNPGGFYRAPSADKMTKLRFDILTTLPVAQILWSDLRTIVESPNAPGSKQFWNAVLDEVAALRKRASCFPAFGCKRIYVGVVSGYDGAPNETKGTTTSGIVGYSAVYHDQRGVLGTYGRSLATHEIGHVLGRPHPRVWDLWPVTSHSFCGENEGWYELNPPVEPHPQDHIFDFGGGAGERPVLGPGMPDRSLAVYGVDFARTDGPHSFSVADPFKNFEVMSYCGDLEHTGVGRWEWPSKHTNAQLRSKIETWFPVASSTKSSGASAPTSYLVVSGSIDDTESVAEVQSIVSTTSEELPLQPPSGEYELKVFAAGTLVQAVAFDPSFPSDASGDGPDVGDFELVVLDTPGIDLFEVWKGDQLIGSLQRSTSAPTVQVTYPNGGEVVSGGSAVISWSSSDADGDPLAFAVEYSLDSGATWTPLAARMSGSELNVDPRQLPGTTHARVRVSVSDGFHSTADESAADFTVPLKGPVASVVLPVTGSEYTREQSVVLRGVGTDLEDGDLPDSAFEWSSSIDGLLGVGRSLSIMASDLSEGVHAVSLAVRDSDGQVGVAQTLMTITEGGAPANGPPIAEAGPDQIVACAGAAGTLVSLQGAASWDGDGDPLTYTWTGAFPEGGGVVLGVAPTVTMQVGSHAVTLSVDDEFGGVATDSLTITVLASAELCDSIDNNCNGFQDESSSLLSMVGHPNRTPGAEFGATVARVADVDGDGVDDFIVGARGDTVGAVAGTGTASLYSGATQSLLHVFSHPGAAAGDHFGSAVAGLADVSGDGVPDVAISADGVDSSAGRAYVFSGSGVAGEEYKLLYELWDPSGSPGDRFGYSVSPLGPIDGDGVPEVIVGARGDDAGRGSATVFSGATGSFLQKLSDPLGEAGDLFGYATAGIGDVNADGMPDIVVGAYQANSPVAADAGTVVVFSGADWTIIRRLYDPTGQAGDGFGRSVGSMGDIDGDGVDDLVVGDPGDDDPDCVDCGSVLLVSGGSGNLLARAVDPDGQAGDGLGYRVARIADVDGDAFADFVASAPDDDTVAGDQAGSAVLFSGATASASLKMDYPNGSPYDGLGLSIAALNDVSGDGVPDILIGAWHADLPGAQDAGRAFLFSGEPVEDTDGDTSPNLCDDDDDGDGAVDAEDCSPQTSGVWAAPSEVNGLILGKVAPTTATLQWMAADGGSAGSTSYDVVRADTADGFETGTCLGTIDGPATSTEDGDLPPAGTGYYYLVRAINGCGYGNSGADSAGTPRPMRICP